MDQQETSSMHILVVVHEQLDQIPVQQEEPPLVQPKDDVPYTLPMIVQLDIVPLEDSLIDQCLDIRVYHDPVERRMMEVFQQVDSKSFGSHAFTLITVEVPCSKFQLTPFNYAFTSEYIKAPFRHMRFFNGLHWKVDFVHCSRRTDHLVVWLHWSFEYDDFFMAVLR
jgi:hypothetical protein